MPKITERDGESEPNWQDFSWISKPMGAQVDIEDKEAVFAILDHERRD